MRYDENERDTLEWNKQIKRSIRRFNEAVKEGQIIQKKEESLEILELIDKKCDFDYELDGIILDQEQLQFIEDIENLIEKRYTKPYYKTQNEWNDELSKHLKNGDIIEVLELMQIGQRFGFAKSIKCISENSEYLAKVTSAVIRLKRSKDRNEER